MVELEHYRQQEIFALKVQTLELAFYSLPRTLLLDLEVNKSFPKQSEQNFNRKKPRKVTLVKGFNLNKRNLFLVYINKLKDISFQLSLKFCHT